MLPSCHETNSPWAAAGSRLRSLCFWPEHSRSLEASAANPAGPSGPQPRDHHASLHSEVSATRGHRSTDPLRHARGSLKLRETLIGGVGLGSRWGGGEERPREADPLPLSHGHQDRGKRQRQRHRTRQGDWPGGHACPVWRSRAPSWRDPRNPACALSGPRPCLEWLRE